MAPSELTGLVAVLSPLAVIWQEALGDDRMIMPLRPRLEESSYIACSFF